MQNKAFKEWDWVSQDPEMLLAYEARHKALLDEQSALKRAERKGKEEGKIEVAKKMLEDGISHEKIAEYTGLSLKEINKLAKSN
ncbi:Rpn family recombination-promoting nuclease/putative transposase [Fictibacillus sp. Mic-4]|uniref:Rpn family recombination-promoting nuclease/putative transposase n=1 Tax=Fictibacillus sp. Mic-4 TaxID=3132826 RepID=UPI003CEBD6CA